MQPMRFLTESVTWKGVALFAVLGIFVGLSAFTFSYAEGTSYLNNDPATCVNCHIMRPQYDAWVKGSHKDVASCNDCHTPHDFFGKWFVKGLNGFNHSRMFTTGNFHEPIQITDLNRQVALNNCKDCHQELVSQVLSAGQHEELDCLACHQGVGHAD
jgi:cytochrome c nitrite reductase small subunit